MTACTPSNRVFLGRPLFLLFSGIHSIINFGILSSGILLTWPYLCSLLFSRMSIMSGFPFTPIISFICSFLILNNSGHFICYSLHAHCYIFQTRQIPQTHWASDFSLHPASPTCPEVPPPPLSIQLVPRDL
jgi:hypothetical protein